MPDKTQGVEAWMVRYARKEAERKMNERIERLRKVREAEKIANLKIGQRSHWLVVPAPLLGESLHHVAGHRPAMTLQEALAALDDAEAYIAELEAKP